MRAGVMRSVRTTKYSPRWVSSSSLSALSRVAKAAWTSSAAAGPITTCLPSASWPRASTFSKVLTLRASSSAAAFIDWVLASMRSKSVTCLIRRSGASWALSSFSSFSLTSSNGTALPGLMLLTRTTCQPSGDWIGAGATPTGRANTPSASGPGGRSFLVTGPSLITPSLLPSTSLAASSSDLPPVTAAMIALALSSLSAIAWSTSRFSAVPNSAGVRRIPA